MVVVAAVLVTDPVKPVVRLVVPALHPLTSVLALNIAGMVGVGAALRVRLPDVELEAAGPVVTHPSIHVVVAARPVLTVGLSVDPLDVVRTLSVTVSGAVGRACRVPRVVEASVLLHLNKVQRAVQTAGKLGHVNVERELLVLQFEHVIVLTGLVHEVGSGTNVLGVLTLGHELQGHRARVVGCDAVGITVVRLADSL